jgi:NADH:ubiquinone oxidoreductase subunit H
MSFALFFLAEYSHIIFMSFLFAILFMGGSSTLMGLDIGLVLKGSFIVFVFVWVRGSFPRLRYDQLMHLLWKTYLPVSIAMVLLTNMILWALGGLPPIICL